MQRIYSKYDKELIIDDLLNQLLMKNVVKHLFKKLEKKLLTFNYLGI